MRSILGYMKRAPLLWGMPDFLMTTAMSHSAPCRILCGLPLCELPLWGLPVPREILELDLNGLLGGFRVSGLEFARASATEILGLGLNGRCWALGWRGVRDSELGFGVVSFV